MKTEFRKVEMPGGLRALMAFDSKIFSKADRFGAEYWRVCEAWWMIVSGARAGCCAFEVNSPRAGWLYIASTAILPQYQQRGFGAMLKAWEVAYARSYGFRRIQTHTREGNAAMIALNGKFGFKVVRTIPGYYQEPDEPAVLMELRLTANRRSASERSSPVKRLS